MANGTASTPERMLKAVLDPWHEAVEAPQRAQQGVLERFLQDYRRTEYGRRHHADSVDTIADYRRAFPVMTYEDYKPLIKRVMGGDVAVLLAEEPIGWAITRGTTKGESKFIPMTPTDMALRISAGRAMMEYVIRYDRLDLFEGVNLNLNFPSRVGCVRVGERDVEYGYSSGIYARYVTHLTPLRSLPTQEEIDALGGETTRSAWEARFELAYEMCREQRVTLVGGVAPTALRFGRWLCRAHRLVPKDLWRPLVMTLGSVPGINTHEAPSLRALYGPAAIREIYGTTEGIFGQQMDEQRAWVPNYDLFLFEVQVGATIKMLHEMRPGELGSLIVSTPTLPRYKIGDLVLAFRAPYFRCIGRDEWWVPLRYVWLELATLNLNQL